MDARRAKLLKTAKLLVVAASLFGMMTLSFQNCSQGSFQSNSQGVIRPLSGSDSILNETEISLISALPDILKESVLTVNFTPNRNVSSSVQSASCQLNENSLTDCAQGSVTYANLPDGDYVFKISLETLSGIQKIFQKMFRKDGTAPGLFISQRPASTTGSAAASFVFSPSDNLSGVASVECSLDNSVLSLCSSPTQLTVTAGSHTYKIKVTDHAGNSTIVSSPWVVDLSMPSISLGEKPSLYTQSSTASFSFSGEKAASFECRLDAGSFVGCASPVSYTNLGESSHNFYVRAKAFSGNFSEPVAYAWIVDKTAPTAPSISSGVVAAVTRLKTMTFNFSSSDSSGIANYSCSLDGGAFANGPSALTTVSLADGNHILKVKAVDVAGNASSENAYTWLIDSKAPTLTFTQTPASSSISDKATFAMSVSDGGSGVGQVQCSLDGAVFANCSSPVNLTGLAAGSHTYRAQAQDKAGNASAVISFSWVVDIPTPPALKDLSIASFGAVASATVNNIVAIQNAIDAAAKQGVNVYVPTGTYGYSGVIQLSGPVRLYGFGEASVLHALDPYKETIFLKGKGATLQRLKLTVVANTVTRQNPYECQRVTVLSATNWTIDHVDIEGGSAAGIMMAGSSNGTVTNNRVSNTLADSIHVTGGSSFITITGNVVTNSGDDGIAVVSYGQDAQSHDVLASNNKISNNKWGRGMTVVGGYNVQYINNHVANVPQWSCFLIAQESSYNTYPGSNVTFQNNTAENCGGAGGHAGIFLIGDTKANTNINLVNNLVLQTDSKPTISIVGANANVVVNNNKVQGVAVSIQTPSQVTQNTPWVSGPVGAK